jgi:hypothetical protein
MAIDDDTKSLDIIPTSSATPPSVIIPEEPKKGKKREVNKVYLWLPNAFPSANANRTFPIIPRKLKNVLR